MRLNNFHGTYANINLHCKKKFGGHSYFGCRTPTIGAQILESVSSKGGFYAFVGKHQLLVFKYHILLLQRSMEHTGTNIWSFKFQNWCQSWFLWLELVIAIKMLDETHAIHKVSSHSAVAASSHAVSCL